MSAALLRGRGRRRAVIAAARELYRTGLVTGTVGNVSVRHGDGLLITPTRRAPSALAPRDVVAVGLDGRVRGDGRPSRELPLHLAVYAERPDVHAIVHTHSPHATAWSFTDQPLTGEGMPRTEELAYYGIAEILTAPAAEPGSPALARNAVIALGDGRAVLLGGHGVLAVGASLDDAIAVAQAVEHQAHVAWLLAGQASATRPASAHAAARERGRPIIAAVPSSRMGR